MTPKNNWPPELTPQQVEDFETKEGLPLVKIDEDGKVWMCIETRTKGYTTKEENDTSGD